MTINKRIRFEILRRDEHTCQYCGATAPDTVLHIDHVVPVALGGSDEPSNLLTACRDCNAGKTSIQPDSPLVARVSDHAAAYALGMLDKITHLRADLEREKQWEAEFLDKWNDWTYPHRTTTQIPRRALDHAWSTVAGAETASHAEVERLEHGVLFINCDSAAWRTQLELMRVPVMTQWNAITPSCPVTSIVFQSSRAKFPRFAHLSPDAPAGAVVTEERKTIALPAGWRASVVRWKSMGIPELLFDKAIRIAMEKRGLKGPEGEFAYMAGVIWRTVDELQVDYDLTPEHAVAYTKRDLDSQVIDAYDRGYEIGESNAMQQLLLHELQDLLTAHIDGNHESWAMEQMKVARRGT